MPHPWDPDHGLSREALAQRLERALAAGQFTGTVDFSARPDVSWFGQGWDCDVFVAHDTTGTPWLCKLPKRRDVAPCVQKEAAILESLEQKGFGLAPRTGLRGSAGELPYEWSAISPVSGESLLSRIEDVDAARLGASLGAAFRAFHSLEPEPIGAKPAHALHTVESLVKDAARALDAIRRHASAETTTQVEAMVARAAGHRPEGVRAAFLHGDLFPEHVFFDAPTLRVTGLIDWAEARWGDPAVDFSVLGWLLGDAFLDAALDAYGDEETAALRARAIRFGTMVGIYDIDAAEKGAPNVPLSARLRVLEARIAEGWLDRI